MLATKLYAPPMRPNLVVRPRLLARLDDSLKRRLTLVSAPAGFGKTTLVAEWLAGCALPAAWLSLDEGDNDPARVLTCLVAAIQTVAPDLGHGVLGVLRSPQPPPPEAVVTALINELADLEDDVVLVVDDAHVITDASAARALSFLVDHLPRQLHLVFITREDPQLQLARLRARGELAELRAADLRFTPAEAGAFFNTAMGLALSEADVRALDARAEGWIAGLQLAALSLQSEPDVGGFIASFTGTHRFVMDYLLEEVLNRQTAAVRAFLLRTAILDRMCGPLCDAMTAPGEAVGHVNGQDMLEQLERGNMFIVPLDSERRWYRYHHLFADLLRQRLQRGDEAAVTPAELHRRASAWFERNGFDVEAFQHAGAAGDIAQAARIMQGNGLPLHFRGAAAPVLKWLRSLPPAVLDATPALRVAQASAQLFVNQIGGIEALLQAAEASLDDASADPGVRDLIGHIAVIRATVGVSQHAVDTIMAQSQRALTYLPPANLPVRTATLWTLGYAHQLLGERAAARKSYSEAIEIASRIGHGLIHFLAMIGLGAIQAQDMQLRDAIVTLQRALLLAGDPPLPVASEAHLNLASAYYACNELEAAQRHVALARPLARQIEYSDRAVACDVFDARLQLAQGDAEGALAALARAADRARAHNFPLQLRAIPDLQIQALLRVGDVAAARARLAEARPLTAARVQLAQGDAAGALRDLALLRPELQQRGWLDELLMAHTLTAVACYVSGARAQALDALADALRMAGDEAPVRLMLDACMPGDASLRQLLAEPGVRDLAPALVDALVAARDQAQQPAQASASAAAMPQPQPLREALSARELELLQLVAQGLSNHEIAARLYLALDTVKGHNRRIYAKLDVQRRTEAVARARALGLLQA